MPINLIGILVMAGDHSFTGGLDHHGVRVLDVLNDANTEFLQIVRVSIFRHAQGEEIAQLDEVTVPKAAIDCLVLEGKSHEAQQRRQHAFVEKRPHQIFAVLANHEIRGTIMLKGTPSPVLAVGPTTPAFFPIIQASVASVNRNGSIPAPVVLVNRSKVSLIQIDRRQFHS